MNNKEKTRSPMAVQPRERHSNAVTRRELLRFGGATGATGLAALAAPVAASASSRLDIEYPNARPENQIYSACLQCNTGCGIKVKVNDGVITKIDGNPYDPFNLIPSVPMRTPVNETARLDAPLCPKGQAGLQSHYDPYRIRQVLKRAGRRGERKWMTIPFEQAITEIVEGGKLFAHVPGEETRVVAGLSELYVLRNPSAFKAMGDDAKAVGKKKMTVAEFRAKHADLFDCLIDPEHPDFGPKNNQFVYMWGRKKDGRAQFAKRFMKAFGSVNAHGHTTVCQGSLYFTGKAMSEQWLVEEKEGKVEGKFDKGDKFYFQIDTEQAEFVLFVGANLFEANYGPTNRAPRVAERIANGDLTIAVVDPRFSKLASKAAKWYPVKPGTDGALAMGIARRIFESGRFDKRFLACANAAAAKAAGEPCWINASWLVKLDGAGKPGPFVRAGELKAAAEKIGMKLKTRIVGDPKLAVFVVQQGDSFVFFDPNDVSTAATGDLFAADHSGGAMKPLRVGELNLATGLDLFRNSAMQCTLSEYAETCGIPEREIAWLTDELTRHGKRAGIDVHRGVSQHPNGFYNVLGFFAINALLGNYGWAGGSIKATTYKVDGTGKGQPYALADSENTLPAPFGIGILRNGKYEESTLFTGYPAPRNWWPHATDIYQEILPSIGDQYPYPVKALMSYMAAAPYALPGGHTNIVVLRDVGKLPLYFACDITIGEMSVYADYIFPDLSFLERWEFQGSHPNMPVKVQPIRQPTCDFGNERVTVFGETMPCSFEAMLLALAAKLGLAGFGPDGLGNGQPLMRAEDYYLKMVANVAAEDSPVADSDEQELRIFRDARRHLKSDIFDESRWRAAVKPNEWPKVVYLLNRGGRFEDYDKAYKGDKHAHPYNKLLSIYCEKIAGIKSAFTGKSYPGYPCFVPVADCLGNPLTALESGYPLTLLTHRVIAMTKSRTISNYWLLALAPENGVLINPKDATTQGLKDGDLVRICSASNPEGLWELGPGWTKPMIGKLKTTQMIMPGCVSFSLGHGHWAIGASAMEIDGKVIPADERRTHGVHANAAMWLDPHLQDTCVIDPIGGSASFYDTKVRLNRV